MVFGPPNRAGLMVSVSEGLIHDTTSAVKYADRKEQPGGSGKLIHDQEIKGDRMQ